MGNGYESPNFEEIRGLLRLVHELHELPAGGEDRRKRMLAGLCELVGAEAGESAIVRVEQGSVRVIRSIRVGTRHGLLSGRVDARDVTDPVLERLVTKATGEVVTRVRRDVVRDRDWYASPFVKEARQGAGVDDAVYSVRPMGVGVFAVVCLARASAAELAIGAREASVVHLLHSEVGWVYDGGPDGRDDDGRGVEGGDGPRRVKVGLSPRQRECLTFLLKGRSEKQIATHLGVSPHTVHVHVKAVYRATRVSTRAELMARFMEPRGRGRRVAAGAV